MELNSKKFFKFLLKIIAFLGIMGAGLEAFGIATGYDHLKGLNSMFDLHEEGNIPTTYSTIQLFFASLLLFFISRTDFVKEKNEVRPWTILSVIFLFLTFDEAAQLHGKSGEIFEFIAGEVPWDGSSWLFPYFLIMLFLGIYFLRFVMTKPAYFRNLFILSGVIFVMGAMGLEIIQGLYMTFTTTGYGYFFMSTIVAEEVMEMLGVAILIYCLLRYIEVHKIPLKIKMAD